ncbi:MAG TPA: MFS transporter, partial [Candidatus Eisenbacteria bacterium]|nr:MFS transporter [Candidatus Eisenbacteria bacterium]
MIVRRPRADRSSPGLRQLDFRRLWAGQAISWLGSEITLLALPLLATLTLHATPTVMALLVASATVPMLAGPFLAGPLVDRFPRRRVMLMTDAARALLLGAL